MLTEMAISDFGENAYSRECSCVCCCFPLKDVTKQNNLIGRWELEYVVD